MTTPGDTSMATLDEVPAILAGGMLIMEITMTAPGAIDVIGELSLTLSCAQARRSPEWVANSL